MGSTIEAVIISGKRKGDLIELLDEEVELSDLREALRGAVEAANEMAAEAKALRLQTEAFVKRISKRRGGGGK